MFETRRGRDDRDAASREASGESASANGDKSAAAPTAQVRGGGGIRGGGGGIQREPREDAKGIGATDGAARTRGEARAADLKTGIKSEDAAAEEDSSDSEGSSSDERAEPETFSDVDDDEVADYIHTDEEVKLRRVIWSELNREYLETQAAKDAAVASAPPGRDGGADGAGAGKKKRKRYTHQVPADSAAEAAHNMLSSKKISSKINYDALNDLFKQDSLARAKAGAGARAERAPATAKPPGEEAWASGKDDSRRGSRASRPSRGSARAEGRIARRGRGRGRDRRAGRRGPRVERRGRRQTRRRRRRRRRREAKEAAAAAAAAAAASAAPRRGLSEATLAEAAMQSTGGRGRKQRGTSRTDWLS